MNAVVTARTAPIAPAAAAEPACAMRADEEWIALAARLPRSRGVVSPWKALLLNAEITGPAKLVLLPGSRELEIRAEFPLDEGVDVDARLRQARDSLTHAAGGSPQHVIDRAESVSDPDAIDLYALAAESGWAFIRRSSGRIAVDLDVPGQFHQAIVEPRAAGFRARAVLAVVTNPSARAKAALAELLLTVTAIVRMARAGATEHEGETAVFVEADIKEPLCPRDVHHALSALAVACRMAGREAKTLVDERLAGAYLMARGWAACK